MDKQTEDYSGFLKPDREKKLIPTEVDRDGNVTKGVPQWRSQPEIVDTGGLRDGKMNFPNTPGMRPEDQDDAEERQKLVRSPSKKASESEGFSVRRELRDVRTGELLSQGTHSSMRKYIETAPTVANADLSGEDLSELGGGDYVQRDWSGASFAGTDVRGAKLRGQFKNTNFNGANLAGTYIDGDLTGATFQSSDLRYATLSHKGPEPLEIQLPGDSAKRKGLTLHNIVLKS